MTPAFCISRPLLFVLGILVVSDHITSAACYTCYAPDGLPVDDLIVVSHQPCKAPGLSTICCALSRNNPPGGNSSLGPTQDECLPNGLCQNRMTTNGNETTTYWANYCTDQNFNGGNCLSICEQSRGPSKNTAVTPCSGKADSDKWCCGANNVACCQNGIGAVTLPKNFTGIVGSKPPSPTATSTTQSSIFFTTIRSTTTSTANSQTSVIPATENNDKLQSGAVAGIIVGVLATFALLGTTIFLATRKSSIFKHKSPPQDYAASLGTGSGTSTPLFGQQQRSEDRQHNELSQENEKFELAHDRIWLHQAVEAQQTPQELPTGLHPSFIRVPEMTLTTPRGTSGHMFRSPI